MSWTTWQFIIIVAIGIIGLTFFVVMHRRLGGRKIDLGHVWEQNWARLAALLGGAYLILTGLIFHSLSIFWWDVLSSFLMVTGFQMFLSGIGIKLELLGNKPAEVDRTDQELSELKSKLT